MSNLQKQISGTSTSKVGPDADVEKPFWGAPHH